MFNWPAACPALPTTPFLNLTADSVNPCFEQGLIPLVLNGTLFLLVAVTLCSGRRSAAATASTTRGYCSVNRALLLCLVAFAGAAAVLFIDAPQFIQHACATASFLLLYVTLQTVHGRGIFTSPTAYDAMPAHAVSLWLTFHTFATVLAVRGAVETLQASPHKSHPGAVMFLLYAAMEIVLLLYVYGQRTGASSNFDPREYKADPQDAGRDTGTARPLLRSQSEEAEQERMVAELAAMSGGGDDPTQAQRSSEYGESLWQLLSFSWLNPLIEAGVENALVLSEFFQLR